MSEFCVILLIAAAGVIGRLSGKKQVQTPVPFNPSQEYGLFLPPDCESIEIKNISQYSTYHHEYPKDRSYDFITIHDPQKVTVTFKKKIEMHRPFPDREVKGVVKSGN